jgi:hypothetical protein
MTTAYIPQVLDRLRTVLRLIATTVDAVCPPTDPEPFSFHRQARAEMNPIKQVVVFAKDVVEGRRVVGKQDSAR